MTSFVDQCKQLMEICEKRQQEAQQQQMLTLSSRMPVAPPNTPTSPSHSPELPCICFNCWVSYSLPNAVWRSFLPQNGSDEGHVMSQISSTDNTFTNSPNGSEMSEVKSEDEEDNGNEENVKKQLTADNDVLRETIEVQALVIQNLLDAARLRKRLNARMGMN